MPVPTGTPFVANDPGFIYLFENANRFKIGRSINPLARLKAAKTWAPDIKVLGVKPFWNASAIERHFHEGFASCWYAGEWFELVDDEYRDVLINGFAAFSDTDRDKNSADFLRWFNSDGMTEFVKERYEQGLTLPKLLQQESDVKKK